MDVRGRLRNQVPATTKTTKNNKEEAMLWALFVVILLLWVLGFSLHVAGSLIHLLLVVAAIVLIVNLLTGRRAAL